MAAGRLIAEQHAKRGVVIIVSAMTKVSDLLLDSMRKAEATDEAGLEASLNQLTERHVSCCRELLPPDFQENAMCRSARAGPRIFTYRERHHDAGRKASAVGG